MNSLALDTCLDGLVAGKGGIPLLIENLNSKSDVSMLEIISFYKDLFDVCSNIENNIGMFNQGASEFEANESYLKFMADKIKHLVETKESFEIIVSQLNDLINNQKEYVRYRYFTGIRYFMGWELELIDKLEDILEDLDITTDPEIISLMKEEGAKLSLADVI